MRPKLLILALAVCAITGVGCGRQTTDAVPGEPSEADAAFDAAGTDVLEDFFLRHPTSATDLGVHAYDDQIEDYSQDGVAVEIQSLKLKRARLTSGNPSALSPDRRIDRELLLHAIDARLLTLEVIKPWAKDPDLYSSGITNSAYVLMKRAFAPPDDRLRLLIAREMKMPVALGLARKNLDSPPRIFTEIALEQIDGNIDFFRNDVPAAFRDVKDEALLAEFGQTNAAVIAALGDYKTFLQKTVLPASNGSFAIGADTYVKKLAADDMIDLPLDRLLQIADADLKKNEAAFSEAAKAIDASQPADRVLASIEADHPAGDQLLQTTQSTLDSLRQFVTEKRIATIPESSPVQVRETPPFMRSTTLASMDTPGPFEKMATEAYYYVTLPDPRWPAPRKEEYLRGWYRPLIANVSVHEAYPGHYLQFLYVRQLSSDVRKVFGASTNSEGWAHYSEQMVIDEGFHADDPRYRLAQLHDALLRDVRFIVGIKMHTQGMSIEEAAKLFETAGHQQPPIALQEAKRGASDPTYGYYTLGKLMLLKLRDDYKAKQGAAYTLQGFHDALMTLGPLPLPLVRQALLGDAGALLP